MMKTINISCKKRLSLLISMIPNQEPRRYGTAMKFGLIPTEGGTKSSVITSSFKVNKCERCSLDIEHHSGARYLSLPELMGDDSCHSFLCSKPISTTKISTSRSHWTRQSTTHHMVIWIDKDGLNPWPNFPMYVAPPLSAIRYFSSMGMSVTATKPH